MKNKLFTKFKLNTLALSAVVVLALTGCTAETNASIIQSDVSNSTITEIAKDAYIYGVAPTYSYKFLMDEVFNEDSINFIGAFNTFRHYQVLNGPDDKMITPAVDFLYGRAWLDLRDAPVVIDVPELKPEDRYYVMQSISLDHYNLDFFGTRTGAQEGGKVLYVGPDYEGEIPEGKFDRIVESPSDFVYMQIRVQTKDNNDALAVKDWQDGISITNMNGELISGISAEHQKGDFMAYDDHKKALYTEKLYEYIPFLLNHIELDEPVEKEMLERFSKIGITEDQDFDLDNYTDEQQAAIKTGFNQGVVDLKKALQDVRTSVGVLGSKEELNHNYLNIATGAVAGIFGNSPAEAMYFGKQMDMVKAGEEYVLHFPADALPPVKDKGFWSITMYNLPERLLVVNELDRYSLGDRSGELKYNEDGSLDIYMQSKAPSEDKLSNWLPTPKEGPFWYIVRLYVPQEDGIDGTWTAPIPEKLTK